jgi:hypothetical protein
MNAEEWLRQQAPSVSSVAGPPDGKDRVIAAVRSYRRRRASAALLAGAGAAAVVLGVGVGLPSASDDVLAPATTPKVTQSATSASRPAAAWINEPGTAYEPPPSPPVTGRACTGRDLEIRASRVGAALGSTVQSIILTNSSGSRCVISRVPKMTMTSRSGDVRRSVEGSGREGGETIALAPGAAAYVIVGVVTVECGSAAVDIADRMSLQVTEGEPSRLVRGLGLPLNCSKPSVRGFGTREPAPDMPSEDPSSRLEATWDGPDAAPAGSMMYYVITLTNSTSADISLDPCPSYTQYAHQKASEPLLLNCADVPVIRAGEKESFAMRLALPTRPKGSFIKVGWHLEVADGTSAGSVISLQ